MADQASAVVNHSDPVDGAAAAEPPENRELHDEPDPGENGEDKASNDASSSSEDDDDDLVTNMTLTQIEWFLARQLKAAAIARFPEEDVLAISDYDFMQHAMSILGNPDVYHGVHPDTGQADEATIQKVLDEWAQLQVFRREYQVEDTLEQGTQVIQAYLESQPGAILYLAYDPRPQDDHERQVAAAAAGLPPPPPRAGCVLVIDFSSMDFEVAAGRAEEEWRTYIVCRYYIMQAMFPHIAAMRAGCLVILEQEGLSFQNQSQQIAHVRRSNEELMRWFPAHYKSIQGYHSPVVAHLVFSMSRPFLSPTVRKRLQLGLRMDHETASEYDRLSDLFGSNTPAVIMRNVTELLEQRYANEEWFTIDSDFP